MLKQIAELTLATARIREESFDRQAAAQITNRMTNEGKIPTPDDLISCYQVSYLEACEQAFAKGSQLSPYNTLIGVVSQSLYTDYKGTVAEATAYLTSDIR